MPPTDSPLAPLSKPEDTSSKEHNNRRISPIASIFFLIFLGAISLISLLQFIGVWMIHPRGAITVVYINPAFFEIATNPAAALVNNVGVAGQVIMVFTTLIAIIFSAYHYLSYQKSKPVAKRSFNIFFSYLGLTILGLALSFISLAWLINAVKTGGLDFSTISPYLNLALTLFSLLLSVMGLWFSLLYFRASPTKPVKAKEVK